MNFKRTLMIFHLKLANILPLNGFQRAKLIRRGGVNVKNGCWIGRNVHFDTVHPELITVESGAIITQGTIILTHYIDPIRRGIHFRNGTVHIGKSAFIGCNTVICNSVTIGDNSIVGAGSIVTKDIPENEIWAGNPARKIKDREYKDKDA